MANLALFATDEKTSSDGIVFEYREDITILVASAARKEFRKAQQKHERKKAAIKGRRSRKDEEQKQIDDLVLELAPMVVEYLLLGWSNLELPQDDKGYNLEMKKGDFVHPVKDYPFSQKNALAILSDINFMDFLGFIYEKAQDTEAFFCEIQEADSKN